MSNSTAYPTNATFLAHTAHQDRGRRDDCCRLCEVHGPTRVRWAQFVTEFPEWGALRPVGVATQIEETGRKHVARAAELAVGTTD